GVGADIQKDLDISDRRFGVLAAAFMIVYTIVSPVMGGLGGRYNRRYMLAFGGGLWSLATIGTAFSRDFYHMFFWRAPVGCGVGRCWAWARRAMGSSLRRFCPTCSNHATEAG